MSQLPFSVALTEMTEQLCCYATLTSWTRNKRNALAVSVGVVLRLLALSALSLTLTHTIRLLTLGSSPPSINAGAVQTKSQEIPQPTVQPPARLSGAVVARQWWRLLELCSSPASTAVAVAVAAAQR